MFCPVGITKTPIQVCRRIRFARTSLRSTCFNYYSRVQLALEVRGEGELERERAEGGEKKKKTVESEHTFIPCLFSLL